MIASGNLGMLCSSTADDSKTAIIDLSRESAVQYYTYGALRQRIENHARGIARHGLDRGSRIAILAANSADFLAAYFGIMCAGMVAVPVNYRLPPATIAYILRDCGAALVMTDAARRGMCPDGVPVVPLDTDMPDPPIPAGDGIAASVADNDPAVIIYTSGSTGRPKGVVLSHSAYLWTIRLRTQAAQYATERFLVAAPLYHMNALNTVKLALAGHATLVLMPRFSAADYVQAIFNYQCTWLTAIPTMIAMIDRQLVADLPGALTSVRTVRLGSEPLTQRILDHAHGLFPAARISNGYGTTEIGSVVFGTHPDSLPTPELSLGYPHPAVSIRLANGANLDADEGVLQVKSPAMMEGYLGLPEQTAAATTEDGYYITRDVMRRDHHGFYYFVGRSDDMFVCGGENIYPGDVERLLLTHPDVLQACVVPLPDPLKGFKPVALVVKHSGADLNEQQLKQYALAHGPAYQHPRSVHFVEHLPISGTEKIDRKASMALAAQLSSAPSAHQVR
ncbi:long-chain fatty acid--CoA ligase [Allopusillimonas soli]|uniref:Acyl--CoA ligase n=2 Tax=Allopusillimonas soli TaxID=659016 RepID=A0A853FCM8_9BURK|nr:class I adenylate-forming enzyme family protein [Allopusillimonas soli]NYT37697.1 acyl--CoA ligase [Allopusillimonas soli]TEA74846.1 long-chain fatty acid--CoA ligase [Allopusillimonas soli]